MVVFAQYFFGVVRNPPSERRFFGRLQFLCTRFLGVSIKPEKSR